METEQVIPLLDSLAHPTLTGRWLNRPLDASFTSLLAGLASAGYVGACAVGIAGRDGYSHREFISECQKHQGLIPVAGVAPLPGTPIASQVEQVRQLGYRAIKIHPRLAGLSAKLHELEDLFQAAAELDLVVFYCTYMHCRIEDYPQSDPLYSLVGLLKRCPQARVVLVHGGDVRLLAYAELVRFNQNLLLDLSLTIMKYRGSSVDKDIGFLFRQFDRRLCVGTDFPEYSPADLRARFDAFSRDLPTEKVENIAYRNLQSFLRC
jgi:predicted TIM-barrel fold metal-dependent hydrolase